MTHVPAHPLRAYRERRGIAQRRFATAAGTTKTTISRIEAGIQEPAMSMLRRLIAATEGEVTADEVLAWRAMFEDAGRPPPPRAKPAQRVRPPKPPKPPKPVPPATRAAAEAIGARFYDTGRPCSFGHRSPRETATGHCAECVRRLKPKPRRAVAVTEATAEA